MLVASPVQCPSPTAQIRHHLRLMVPTRLYSVSHRASFWLDAHRPHAFWRLFLLPCHFHHHFYHRDHLCYCCHQHIGRLSLRVPYHHHLPRCRRVAPSQLSDLHPLLPSYRYLLCHHYHHQQRLLWQLCCCLALTMTIRPFDLDSVLMSEPAQPLLRSPSIVAARSADAESDTAVADSASDRPRLHRHHLHRRYHFHCYHCHHHCQPHAFASVAKTDSAHETAATQHERPSLPRAAGPWDAPAWTPHDSAIPE
mmetsp:Transcript_17434/g.49232  ORF Transcript_17434/g.49232 Transcript_17434/m.49232 type:complete len:253 (+) Transcript_17434:1655-2413(+)